MLNEFKNFIAKGNVMDMAVGIIMGAAFTAIVTSLVKDILNPFIGLATGGIDFAAMYYNLSDQDYASLAAAQEAGAATVNYGVFINAIINFLIVAFVVFMLVKTVNRIKEEAMKKEEEEAAAPVKPSADVQLLMEIRDLMAAQTKAPAKKATAKKTTKKTKK